MRDPPKGKKASLLGNSRKFKTRFSTVSPGREFVSVTATFSSCCFPRKVSGLAYKGGVKALRLRISEFTAAMSKIHLNVEAHKRMEKQAKDTNCVLFVSVRRNLQNFWGT